jgi:hypothetical protein
MENESRTNNVQTRRPRHFLSDSWQYGHSVLTSINRQSADECALFVRRLIEEPAAPMKRTKLKDSVCLARRSSLGPVAVTGQTELFSFMLFTDKLRVKWNRPIVHLLPLAARIAQKYKQFSFESTRRF